jgi:hypothetical protein
MLKTIKHLVFLTIKKHLIGSKSTFIAKNRQIIIVVIKKNIIFATS